MCQRKLAGLSASAKYLRNFHPRAIFSQTEICVKFQQRVEIKFRHFSETLKLPAACLLIVAEIDYCHKRAVRGRNGYSVLFVYEADWEEPLNFVLPGKRKHASRLILTRMIENFCAILFVKQTKKYRVEDIPAIGASEAPIVLFFAIAQRWVNKLC